MLNPNVRQRYEDRDFDEIEPTECRIDEPALFDATTEYDVHVLLKLKAVATNVTADRDGGNDRRCEVVLVGRVAKTAMHDGANHLPAEIDIAFGPGGRIRSMTISVIDPRTLSAGLGNLSPVIDLTATDLTSETHQRRIRQ